MTLQEGFAALSEEEIMAISEELMRKNHKAYAALAGFQEEAFEHIAMDDGEERR